MEAASSQNIYIYIQQRAKDVQPPSKASGQPQPAIATRSRTMATHGQPAASRSQPKLATVSRRLAMVATGGWRGPASESWWKHEKNKFLKRLSHFSASRSTTHPLLYLRGIPLSQKFWQFSFTETYTFWRTSGNPCDIQFPRCLDERRHVVSGVAYFVAYFQGWTQTWTCGVGAPWVGPLGPVGHPGGTGSHGPFVARSRPAWPVLARPWPVFARPVLLVFAGYRQGHGWDPWGPWGTPVGRVPRPVSGPFSSVPVSFSRVIVVPLTWGELVISWPARRGPSSSHLIRSCPVSARSAARGPDRRQLVRAIPRRPVGCDRASTGT